MKLLFDLLPVVVFFLAFRAAKAFPEATLGMAASLFSVLEGSPEEQAELSAVILATVLAIGATVLQIGWLLVRRQRIKPSVWISAGLIVIFGGLTIWLHNPWFIKWKPSILYWIFALVLAGGKLFWRRNLLGALLSEEIGLPPEIWDRLLYAWVAFFALLGAANLAVAYTWSTDVWVNFKTFGLLGLTLGFSVLTGVYVARFIQPEGPAGGRGANG